MKRAFPGTEREAMGNVSMQFHPIKWLKCTDMRSEMALTRIRGVAYGGKVAAQLLNQMVSSAKGVLLPLVTDVWFKTELDAKAGVSGMGF